MSAKDKNTYDVIVIGGGLAGLTMTALLAANNIHVVCIDRIPLDIQMTDEFDGRTTAISYGSRKVLKAAGAWEPLVPEASPINRIHILDGDSPVLLDFKSKEVEGRSFGWIIENRRLRHALIESIQNAKTADYIAPVQITGFRREDDIAHIDLKDGNMLSAPLLIGADGRNSFTRESLGITTRDWRYNQQAIVCTVIHENPHDDIAVEHFRREGPFAVLPMTDDEKGNHRSSVVWTEHGNKKDSAKDFDQDIFDLALTERFPDRYGAVKQIGKRFSYPLGLVHAHEYTGKRTALIAEAAHGIHPIAGQGLNMGYRDIAALAALIVAAKNNQEDPGSDRLLSRYQRERRFDNMAMAGATDSLNKLFSNDFTPIRLLRRAGLKLVAKTPPAKQFFMKQAMGAAGLLPALIRDEGDENQTTGEKAA